MFSFLVFVFLLTPLPSFQASIGERKNNQTKPTNHVSALNTPRPVSALLNIKPKPQNPSSKVNRILSSSTKPVVTPSVESTSEDKPPTSSPITVVIREACIQTESQKDTINTTKVQETELSLKPGSPLVMTHHINVVPGPCTGGCGTEMAALKDRLELLEKEMSALKRKCSLCSEGRCPNNCSGHGKCEDGKCMCHHGFSGLDCSATSCPSNCTKNGKCVNGKCLCQTGFTGIDCSKGTNKDKDEVTVVSPDSNKAKQNTSTMKQTNKADEKGDEKKQKDDKNVKTVSSTTKPVIETRNDKYQYNGTSKTKDKGARNQAITGKNVESKTASRGLLQTDRNLNTNNIKQENKVLSLNPNVTQVDERKMNGTLKGLLNLAIGTNQSAQVKNSDQSLSNVTSVENVKKVEKQTNVTASTEKDKKRLQDQGKTTPEKHLNVTASSDKDRKSNQGNVTLLKEVIISGNKIVEKHLNVSAFTDKDKKFQQSTGTALNTAQETTGMRNVTVFTKKDKKQLHDKGKTTPEKHLNVTASTDKDRKSNQGIVTLLKEVITSGKKVVEKDLNVSPFPDKDKKLQQGTGAALNTAQETTGMRNVTTSSEKQKLVQVDKKLTFKEVTTEQKKVEKQVNVTVSTEKAKSHQSNITAPKVKTPGMRNLTTSSEKNKKLVRKEETALKEVTSGQKKVEKHLIVTTSSEKGGLNHIDVTVLNEKTSGIRNSTTSSEKEKKTVYDDKTIEHKDATSGQKKVEKHLNVTTSSEKDKLNQLNVTVLNEKTTGTRNVTTYTEKHKMLVHEDETPTLKVTSGQKKIEKGVNATLSNEQYNKLHQGNVTLLKQVTSGQKKVEKHLNETTTNGKDNKVNQVTALTEKTFGMRNVTSSSKKEKLLVQGDATPILKEVTFGQKKVDKHLNVTISSEKVNKLHRVNATTSNGRTPGMKNATTSSQKEKTLVQVDETPAIKEVTSGQKKVEKYLNVTTSSDKDILNQVNVTTLNEKTSGIKNSTPSNEKDNKLIQDNKTSGQKQNKVEKDRSVTASNDKDKKSNPDNATILKPVTPGQKKVEKYLNVTTSAETDKKLSQANVTAFTDKTNGIRTEATSSKKEKKIVRDDKAIALKNVTSGQEKVEKHGNLTVTTEKDSLHQGNATALNEKTSGTSREKQRLIQGNETKITMGKKTLEKFVNVTSIEKVKEQHRDGVTPLKEGSPAKAKIDSSVKVTTSSKSEVTLLNKNEKNIRKDSATLNKTEKHKNATASTEKDIKLHKGNVTLITEASSEKRKVDTSDKNKNILQGDKTKSLKPTSGKQEIIVNSTISIQEDWKLHQSHEEGVTTNKHLNATSASDEKQKNLYHGNERPITKGALGKEKEKFVIQQKMSDTKSHGNRTTKLTDIGPVEIHNITATGFVITWEAPEGVFRNFTVIRREVLSGSNRENGPEETEKSQAGNKQVTTGNELHNSNRTTAKVHHRMSIRSAEKFSRILAGTARSYHFRNLRPQTTYSVSLYSSGPRVRSTVQRLLVSTGPEPPTELIFSNITETALSVSWTKPKSTVTGFKVTYTDLANGVTGSMSVDSQLSHVLISKLSAGSSYEISVRSVIEAIESEPTTASVVTVPDAPTNLQVVNITDTKALLVWKPPKAKVDHYVLSYGSTKSPNVTVTVMLSGKSVEHQLRNLHRSTVYTLKIMSQINSLQSSSISTTFTTTSGLKVQEVTLNKVTWNSAVISWKAPRLAFRSYRLTYQLADEVTEVILNPTVSQYELTDLAASSNYTVKVDGESEGQYICVATTAITTTQLPYPYPADCSQVQLNGLKKSGEAEIYPEGKDGEPLWVYCDMETAGGGWTVFQRRVDGSTDFSRGWKDYSKGFGDLSAEFWLGNDLLHTLTSMVPMSLRVDLHLGNDTAYAQYSNFTVGSEENHYAIEASGYSGTAGNSMSYHSGRPFSTKDKDPSPISVHCAKSYMGGWWYKNCYKANLNGLYATFSQDQGVVWIDWKGKDASLPFTEMKLRPNSLSHMTSMTQG